MIKKEETDRKRSQHREVLLGILLLGSIWGFLEVVLGGGMQAVGIPYKGDVLTGLGIGTMAIAFALYRRASLLIAVALVAVALKQLAVPILHLQFICKANSCLAVTLGGCALAGSVAIAGRRLERGILPRAAAGFSAGLLAGAGFYFIGMHVAPCRYLLSFNRPGGFAAFMLAEGLIWAALGAVFFPVGYRVGQRLESRLPDLRARRPAFYYLSSTVAIACCWVIGAIAIARGL
jgi:hypothetical protein